VNRSKVLLSRLLASHNHGRGRDRISRSYRRYGRAGNLYHEGLFLGTNCCLYQRRSDTSPSPSWTKANTTSFPPRFSTAAWHFCHLSPLRSLARVLLRLPQADAKPSIPAYTRFWSFFPRCSRRSPARFQASHLELASGRRALIPSKCSGTRF